MPERRILRGGGTCGVSFGPFPNSSGWWRLICSLFLARASCRETTHANGYYGAWPGWNQCASPNTLITAPSLLSWRGRLSRQLRKADQSWLEQGEQSLPEDHQGPTDQALSEGHCSTRIYSIKQTKDSVKPKGTGRIGASYACCKATRT